ncbi:MAG: chorismate synthase [Oscillospiraceae bacterium]|nr:chorismate synthase [Oscillospiraceae bacterium]
MSSTFGEKLRVSIFGQSHSAAIGVVIDGLPAGTPIDLDELRAFMKRRVPGQSATSTSRVEADEIEILSGVVNYKTCGAPLSAIIRNTDTRSGDYSEIRDVPRPGHADYTAGVKYGGNQDVSGGGHFSGRLTAPLCVAGGICVQLLKSRGIEVSARIISIGTVTDSALFDEEILKAKSEGDSVGGVIECVVTGLPAGLGEPMFGGVENRISAAVFGIPAVKGIEFGSGFAGAATRGTVNNDSFYMDGDKVKTRTNHCGGILGGITNGMPVVFRVAVKPTPSISREQESVSLSRGENAAISVKGRHDPCIVPRAVVCVESAAAVVFCDMLL